MATEAQQSAIADIILDVFSGDAALFRTFLTRARLQADLDGLSSFERGLRAGFAGDQEAFNAALAANQAAQAAKQAEIDAL